VADHVGRTVTTPTFEQFFRAEHVRLVAIGLAMAPDVETAQDAAQEALARAFAHWDRVATLEQPGAWVRRVLINLLIDGHRRRARDQRAAAGFWSRELGFSTEQDVDGFLRMTSGLPERQRLAVVLRYVDDLSVADVAVVMDVAEGTVKALLFKARRGLTADLARSEELR
jgi:RNA polymerase sigma-70 factor (ECF subfamily)